MADKNDTTPKTTIQFAPGCFDDFDGTQQELDEFIAELTAMAESGALMEDSISLEETDLSDLPDDVKAFLTGWIEDSATMADGLTNATTDHKRKMN